MTRTQASGAPAVGAPAGLRERKKQRTREALLHTALELFTTQGYDTTTIDEIVDAVEVSQRTFFRYFANKEAAAFAIQEKVELSFLSELRRRPAGESPSRPCAGPCCRPGSVSPTPPGGTSRSRSRCGRTG